MDEETTKLFEEINRLLFLASSKCTTKAAIDAHDTAQAAVLELEKELKIPGNGTE